MMKLNVKSSFPTVIQKSHDYLADSTETLVCAETDTHFGGFK